MNSQEHFVQAIIGAILKGSFETAFEPFEIATFDLGGGFFASMWIDEESGSDIQIFKKGLKASFFTPTRKQANEIHAAYHAGKHLIDKVKEEEEKKANKDNLDTLRKHHENGQVSL